MSLSLRKEVHVSSQIPTIKKPESTGYGDSPPFKIGARPLLYCSNWLREGHGSCRHMEAKEEENSESESDGASQQPCTRRRHHGGRHGQHTRHLQLGKSVYRFVSFILSIRQAETVKGALNGTLVFGVRHRRKPSSLFFKAP